MVRAVVTTSGGVTANINKNNSGAQKVSVTTPSLSTAGTLRSLTDVNATSLADGSLLQYDSATDKFITRTTLSTETGTLKFNGGNF